MSGYTRVKLCGLTCKADVTAAVAAGADAIGVIAGVPVDSHREVSLEMAQTLVSTTPPFVTRVLVTMPDTVDEALSRIDRIQPDMIQLHGTYNSDDLARIAEHIPVIHAFDVGNVAGMQAVESIVDAVLIDSTDEQGAGGTGETHDWERARTRVHTLSVPVILAGGLTPTNVGEAVEQVRPYGVDVASGVETNTRKDPAAMASFVRAARGGA